MRTGRQWSWLVLALLAGTAARAAEPPEAPGAASGPAYPLPLALRVEPGALAASYAHSSGQAPALLESTVVPVGPLALEAHRLVAARAYAQAGGAPAGELVLEAVEGFLDYDAAGWRARVRHDVALRVPGQEAPLARWRVEGEGLLLGVGAGRLEAAFRAASTAAARWLAHDFETAPGAAGLLGSRGVALLGEQRPAPPEPLARAPRYELAGREEAGGPALPVELLAGLTGVSDLLQVGVRAGVQWRWLLLEAAYERSSGEVGIHADRLEQTRFGADASAVLRPADGLELGAGLGLRQVEATTEATSFSSPWRGSSVASGLLGSAFLQARLVFGHAQVPGKFRAGLEVRQALGGSMTFGAEGSTPGAGASRTVAATELSLVVGYQIPLGE